jgi:hypothetical protein
LLIGFQQQEPDAAMGDFFKPEQLEALWAYVTAGER